MGGEGLNRLECLGSKCSQVQVQVQAAEAKCSPIIPYTSHHPRKSSVGAPHPGKRKPPTPHPHTVGPPVGLGFFTQQSGQKSFVRGVCICVCRAGEGICKKFQLR